MNHLFLFRIACLLLFLVCAAALFIEIFVNDINSLTAIYLWAGLGVIENDFHNRKDLTPNVCAVYTEENRRLQGIAGALLARVCSDMKEQGIDTLYLLTDHTSFYERYGWEFFCMVQGDGEPEPSRMYIHRA